MHALITTQFSNGTSVYTCDTARVQDLCGQVMLFRGSVPSSHITKTATKSVLFYDLMTSPTSILLIKQHTLISLWMTPTSCRCITAHMTYTSAMYGGKTRDGRSIV